MQGTQPQALDRRGLLAGALAAGAAAAVPATTWAQATGPAVEAVQHLRALAARNALSRLAQPSGFLNSVVAQFGLPVLFVRGGAAQSGPLADAQFREKLTQRLNILAEAGARGAAPVVADAARKLPVGDAQAILHGRAPTAATSQFRLEMGSGLVNAIRAPLEQALVAAQDPLVAQAIAVLPGVTLGDVAHSVALAADNGIWYEIGAAEAAIRANPSATGDPVLIAALNGASSAP